MISNVDKFKDLVHVVNETNYSIVGKYNNLNIYLFYYNKADKDIVIHTINVHKEYDNEGNLMLWSDWSTKKYKTEKPALKALSNTLRTLKEFYNLFKVKQINEDF